MEARRGHQIPLELELPVVVRCLVWVLGTDPGSSGRAIHALSFSPIPSVTILNHMLYVFRSHLVCTAPDQTIFKRKRHVVAGEGQLLDLHEESKWLCSGSVDMATQGSIAW